MKSALSEFEGLPLLELAQRYLELAAQARLRAERADEKARVAYFRIAEQWELLAQAASDHAKG